MKKTFFTLVSIVAAGIMTACSGPKPASVSQAPDNVLTLLDCDSLAVTGGMLYLLKDNADDKLNSPSLFADAPDSVIQQLGLAEGIPASISAYVLRCNDGSTILFDAGLGPKMGGGNILRLMGEYGLSPESIDYICLTHLHADHIGGLVGPDGMLFPNAQVWLGQVEHDAWMSMSDDKNGLQKSILGMYSDRLHLFAFGDELPCGVTAIDAVGHTPGHTVFRSNEILIIGDLLHGYALQSVHPEYCANFDMDKEQAVQSRKRIFDLAADSSLVMVGMHMPASSVATRTK